MQGRMRYEQHGIPQPNTLQERQGRGCSKVRKRVRGGPGRGSG